MQGENKTYQERALAAPLLRLGLACNQNCLFCNVPPECGEIAGKEHVIKQIISSAPGTCLSLSGGEPTLYPFLPEIIRIASSRGIRTELQTNAVLLADREKAKILADSGLTQAFVSLHSHIASVNDFLTGLKGSWENCVRGIKNLQDLGVNIVVNTVITSANYRYLPDFIVFIARRLNVRFMSLSVVQPRKRAFRNSALLPDYSVLDSIVRRAMHISERENVWVDNPVCGLPLCIGGWESRLEKSMEYIQSVLGEPFVKGKIKPKCCATCKAYKYCGGIWEEYKALRGTNSLKPFKHFDGQIRKRRNNYA